MLLSILVHRVQGFFSGTAGAIGCRSARRELRRGASRYSTAPEQLEERQLLAAVSWDGGGGDLIWSNAQNWSGNQLPGPTDDVNVNPNGTATILFNGPTTTIRSLSLSDSLSLTGGSITVSQSIAITKGSSVTVSGAGVSLTGLGTATIDGASFYVTAGTLSLPGATNYTHTNNASDIVTFRATGSTSVLDLGNLQTIVSGNDRYDQLNIEALSGGRILLGKVTDIIDPSAGDTRGRSIHLKSTGSGSLIDLAVLKTFQDVSSQSDFYAGLSSIDASTGGTVQAPLLDTLTAVQLNLDGTGTLPISQIKTFNNGAAVLSGASYSFPSLTDASGTSFTMNGNTLNLANMVQFAGGSMTANGAVVDMSKVTNLSKASVTLNSGSINLNAATTIDGASFYVTAGTLSLPGATNYTHTIGSVSDIVTFRATGSTSVLDLGNLQTIVSGNDRYDQLNIEALSGGRILLGKVTDIIDPSAGDTRGRSIHLKSTGSGSLIDLAVLKTFQDVSSQSDFYAGLSSIDASTGGTVQAPLLDTLTAVQLNLDGTGTLPISQIKTFNNGAAVLSGASYSFPSLTDASGTSFTMNGNTLNLANMVQFAGGSMTANGAVVDMSKVTNLSKASVTLNSGSINLNAATTIDGASFYVTAGTLSLPGATNYTHTNNASDIVTFRATGSTSVLDLGNLQTIVSGNDRYDQLNIEALSGGRILLGKVTDIIDPSAGDTRGRSIHLKSTGSGSLIDLAVLKTFQDVSSQSDFYAGLSSIDASTGGTVQAPLLDTLTAVQLNLDGTGTLPISQIKTFNNGAAVLSGASYSFPSLTDASGTSFTMNGNTLNLANMVQFAGGSMTANGAVVDMSKVTNLSKASVTLNSGSINLNAATTIDGASFYVTAGTLSLPGATNYTHTIGSVSDIVTFRATGSTSVLDLGNLQTIVSGNDRYDQLNIEALSGGRILLGKVTDIIDPSAGDTRGRSIHLKSTGSGSLIDLAVLKTFQDVSSQSDFYAGLSSIDASTGGTVQAPLLDTLTAVQLNLDGTGTLPISQIKTFNNGAAVLSGASYSFPSLTDASGTSFTMNGNTLNLANMVQFAGGSMTANGAVVDMSKVTNLSKASVTLNSGSINLNAATTIDGASFYVTAGTLSLPGATNYTHTIGSVSDIVTFRATGSTSVLDLGNLQTIVSGNDRYDQLNIEALSGGRILLGKVTDIIDPSAGDTRGRSIHLKSTGSGSLIDLAVLKTFQDVSSQSDFYAGLSSIDASTGGTVQAPLLDTLTAVQLNLDGTGTLPISQIKTFNNGAAVLSGASYSFPSLTDASGTSFTMNGNTLNLANMVQFAGGSMTANGAVVDMSKVTNLSKASVTLNSGSINLNAATTIDGASFYVTAGTLSLPGATNYTHTIGSVSDIVTFRATGSTSVLDLGNLQTIVSGNDRYDQLNIEALSGGRILLGKVTDIIDPSAGDTRGRSIHLKSTGSGSLIDLAVLKTFQDVSSQSDFYAGLSSIDASTGGTFSWAYLCPPQTYR